MIGLSNDQWQRLNNKIDKLIAASEKLSKTNKDNQSRLLELERAVSDMKIKLSNAR